MEQQPIAINVTLTEDEFIQMQKEYSKRRRGALLVLLVVLIMLLNFLGDGWSWGTFAVTMLLALLAGLVLFPLLLRRQWKKQYRTHAALHQAAEYTFSPGGIATHAANGDARYSWEEIYAAIALPGGMLFFLSTVNAFFIPQSAIGPQQDAMLAYVARAPKRKRSFFTGVWK